MERTDEQKTRPVKGAKKGEGWREREEARSSVLPQRPHHKAK
jgi:hypothetical protein